MNLLEDIYQNQGTPNPPVKKPSTDYKFVEEEIDGFTVIVKKKNN